MDNLLNKYVWLIETIYKAKNLNDNKVKIYALDRIHHLEVLEPQWLREEIAGTVEKMWEKYKKRKK